MCTCLLFKSIRILSNLKIASSPSSVFSLVYCAVRNRSTTLPLLKKCKTTTGITAAKIK